MKESLRGKELLSFTPIVWDIAGEIKALPKSPGEIFGIVSNPEEVSIIPGFKSAVLIAGEKQTVGALYQCEFGIDSLPFGGQVVIELTRVEAPHRASAKLSEIRTPLSRLILNGEGRGEWEIFPKEGRCSLILETEGRITGLGVAVLRMLGFNESFIERETEGMLRDLKERINRL